MGLFQQLGNGDGVALFNRLTNDGTLVTFQQASTTEGSISVSGTTVSLTTVHTCRVGPSFRAIMKFTPKKTRPQILRGTVLTTLTK